MNKQQALSGKHAALIITVAALLAAGVAKAAPGDRERDGRRGAERGDRTERVERPRAGGDRRGAVSSEGRFGNRVDNRQDRQRARVRNGIEDGEISRREFAGLRQDQQRIRKAERHFEADGMYSKRERRVMERLQDQASRNIKRAKTNDRFPGHGDGYARGHGKNRFDGHRGYKDYGRRGWDRDAYRYGRHPHWGRGRFERTSAAEPEVIEVQPASSYSHGVEVEFDGVHVVWNRSGQS
ncbi:MAG: hypothetical protein ACPGUC_03855 [Gammaproteobacteria bacterium]